MQQLHEEILYLLKIFRQTRSEIRSFKNLLHIPEKMLGANILILIDINI